MAVIMSVDESGKPPDPVFVLAGVLLHESVLPDLNGMLDGLRRDLGLPPDAEFHARDIVHGKGVFAHIREFDKRRWILEEILKTLGSIGAVVVAVVGRGPARDENQALTQAFRFLIERGIIAFDKRAERDELMVLVIDETDYKNDWVRARLVEAEIEHGIYTSRWFATSRVIKRPVFLPSKSFGPLQLADVVAYIIRRVHSGGTDRLGFNVLYRKYVVPSLDRCRDGRVEGCGLKRFDAR